MPQSVLLFTCFYPVERFHVLAKIQMGNFRRLTGPQIEFSEAEECLSVHKINQVSPSEEKSSCRDSHVPLGQ
jgi:hypothetical protein